jgi:hypothetical protein
MNLVRSVETFIHPRVCGDRSQRFEINSINHSEQFCHRIDAPSEENAFTFKIYFDEIPLLSDQ